MLPEAKFCFQRVMGHCDSVQRFIYSFSKYCSLAPEKCSIFMSIFHPQYSPIIPAGCGPGEQG